MAKFLLLRCNQKVLEHTPRNLKSSKHFLGARGSRTEFWISEPDNAEFCCQKTLSPFLAVFSLRIQKLSEIDQYEPIFDSYVSHRTFMSAYLSLPLSQQLFGIQFWKNNYFSKRSWEADKMKLDNLIFINSKDTQILQK